MKQHACTETGVQAVLDVVQSYDIQPSQDGLEFASPGDFSKWNIEGVTMPDRLRAFLDDLRVLRRIPISYLVPDPDLLPPESIRFFHVNQTWIDRVIDGVFSNTNIGTVDFHYSLTTLQLVRAAVNPAPDGMTGILIRSELTRRWPKMIVRAFSSVVAGVDDESTIPVLRAEAISRDIFIALFAGQPKRLHIREPFEGVRFGVELIEGNEGEADDIYVVDQRDPNGIVQDDDEPITFRSSSLRTLDVDALRGQLVSRSMGDPRGVALHLEQLPFVQVFQDTALEQKGSVPPPPDNQVPLRNGKTFTLKFATQALFKLDT
jgi:hypothetical protein